MVTNSVHLLTDSETLLVETDLLLPLPTLRPAPWLDGRPGILPYGREDDDEDEAGNEGER